jgi:hypothetical protein
MILALLALLAAAPAGRPFSEERYLLDRRLETLRRILPDGANPAVDMAVVKELAEAARLGGVDIQARQPVEAGARGDVLLELTATARYLEVDRFFRQVTLHHRLIDVESLSLTAAPDGALKLVTQLRLPFRPLRAPLPPPPDDARDRLGGVPRPQIDQFVRDQSLALAKAEAIVALRRSKRNPRLFLSELAAVTRDRPVVLTHASLGEEFLIRGLTVGEGPSRALESRFERGFFRVGEFLMARWGACRRFEVRGKCPVAGIDAELALPAEDPFEPDTTPCRIDRDGSRGPVVRGPNTKTPGKGPLTLRLRDVDLADVFLILHQLTTQSFLVDGDVTGRVSLELARVTLDEALALLAKSAGLRVSEPGPVRRVLRGSGPPLPALMAHGGTVTASFAVKRADVREILAVLTDLDPGLAALGPPGSYGRVSLWATNLALADIRATALSAAGLEERLEEDRRILGRGPSNGEPVHPVAGETPERRLGLRPQDLAVLEFELAGVASAGDQWTAFAYAPTGVLNAYRVGDRLADGLLREIQSTDVLLDTDEGPLRVPLAPLPR